MIFFSDILPFILLFKKLKNKLWALLVVVLLMNFAKGMEWLSFSGSSGNGWGMGYTVTPLVTLLVSSVLLAIFITGISIVVTKYRKTQSNDINVLD